MECQARFDERITDTAADLEFLDRVAITVVEGLILHGDVYRVTHDPALRRIMAAVAYDVAVDLLEERRLRREAMVRWSRRAVS